MIQGLHKQGINGQAPSKQAMKWLRMQRMTANEMDADA
jgi:hypothetical protein